MKDCKAVIFDLDGTLLDTSEGIFRSVDYVIEKLQLPAIGTDIKRTFIGPPMQKSFERVFGLSSDEAWDAANLFRERYKDHDLLMAVPYDGMIKTVKELSKAGIHTAVATYKRQDYAERILDHFGFTDICDVICGSDMEGKLTKKDIIENAMRYMNVSPSQTVMVGDSDNDAIGAKEVGASFIAAIYGFGFADPEYAESFPNIGIAGIPEDILRFVL